MARKIVYLHAGATKTGSSALQTWLARNLDALDRAGIHYPSSPNVDKAKTGVPTNGNALDIGQFNRRAKEGAASLQDTNFFHDLQRVLSTGYERILYSSESFQDMQLANLMELNSAFSKHGVNPVVIYFVRNIAEHAFSLWGQFTKRTGMTSTWAEFLRDYQEPFSQALRGLSEAFGREAIICVNYDNVKDDIVGTLLSIVGAYTTADTKVENINRSLSAKEISYMLFFNERVAEKIAESGIRRLTALSAKVSNHLLAYADATPLPLSLSPEQLACLLERNREGMDYVNSTFVNSSPICIARSDQIGEAIQLEDLSQADRAIAALLVDALTQEALDDHAERRRARRLARRGEARTTNAP